MLQARVRSELGPGAVSLFSSRSGLLNVGAVLELTAFCPRARWNIGTNENLLIGNCQLLKSYSLRGLGAKLIETMQGDSAFPSDYLVLNL